MSEFGKHAGYIIASYAAAAIVLGALVAQTVVAYRSAKQRLGAARDEA
ncbi:MAG: heme exporter protein CcmD [Beijerinckiaceae bacterium]